jgi:RNA 2',3'-cyclic 3'-phosphodiesterase
MRTFVAIELPAEVKRALAALQDELRAARADVSWPKAENFHLTLKFLGEVEEARVAEVKQACAEAASAARRFDLQLEGVGLLPHRRQPRVVYVAVAGQVRELGELQQSVEEKLAALGFEQAARAFTPHVTLGRVKSRERVRELVAACEARPFATGGFAVGEIVLMRSELHAAGARYTPLCKWLLTNQG